MKYSDDEYDENLNKSKAIVFSILCGATTAFVSSYNSDASCIFIAILIGSLIALKIDGIHHVVTLITFLLIFFLLGIPEINFIALLIASIGAFIDEVGNDNLKLYSKSKFLKYFFDYRFAMKIAILILAIFGFLYLETFIYFILFEISYEFSGFLFKKLNN